MIWFAEIFNLKSLIHWIVDKTFSLEFNCNPLAGIYLRCVIKQQSPLKSISWIYIKKNPNNWWADRNKAQRKYKIKLMTVSAELH